MKINPKQYARSLIELSSGLSKVEIEKLVARFVLVLKERHDLNKSEIIVENLDLLLEEQIGEMKAELVSARSLSVKSKGLITNYLSDKLGGVKLTWQEKIDDTLLGGFILRYQGFVIDGSVKTNLNKFKKQLLIK
ncbi:MAG: F0F1 ATP synthase subunit delta [Bacilli bacterium]|nr:F0F1 ATP synthase subunit delta [Bacilli bacterium]